MKYDFKVRIAIEPLTPNSTRMMYSVTCHLCMSLVYVNRILAPSIDAAFDETRSDSITSELRAHVCD